MPLGLLVVLFSCLILCLLEGSGRRSTYVVSNNANLESGWGPPPGVAELPGDYPPIGGLIQDVNENRVYISPWDFERRPNPYMFPHLQGDDSNPDEVSQDQAALNNARPIPIYQPPSLLAPARSPYHNGRLQSGTANRDTITSIGLLTPAASPESRTITLDPTFAHSEQEKNAAEDLQSVAPKYDIAVSDLSATMNVQSYTCSECALTFRTPGQRNKHVNRKHIRRYTCTSCDAAFNLRLANRLYGARKIQCSALGRSKVVVLR